MTSDKAEIFMIEVTSSASSASVAGKLRECGGIVNATDSSHILEVYAASANVAGKLDAFLQRRSRPGSDNPSVQRFYKKSTFSRN